MRSLVSHTAAAAGTIAAIGIGTPIFALVVLPVICPVAVAAAAIYAWRADER
jgi:hypothetical protein